MALRTLELPAPQPDVAAIGLSGTVDRISEYSLTDFTALLSEQGSSCVILDLSELSAINLKLAVGILDLRRWLEDRGGRLEISGANTVVRWFLQQQLGDLTVTWHEDATAAAAAIAGESEHVDDSDDPDMESPQTLMTGNDDRRRPHDAARPDRFIFSALEKILADSATVVDLQSGVSSLLRRCGLAHRCRMIIRDGDALRVAGHEDYAVAADGWLGSLLNGASCPMSLSEIGDDGLSRQEQALLRWSASDLYVPMTRRGTLVGVLCLDSSRSAGLWSYTSGESLALSLTARALAEKLDDLEYAEAAETDLPPRVVLTPVQIDALMEEPLHTRPLPVF